MKHQWTLHDIIDFEYLINKDKENLTDETDRHHRDRNIFLDILQNQPEASPPKGRRNLFRSWLIHMREIKVQDTNMPGSFFNQAMTFSYLFISLMGLISGTVITTAFLEYDGSTPVNIFVLLFILLLPQLLLFLCLLASYVRRIFSKSSQPTLMIGGLTNLTLYIFDWLTQRVSTGKFAKQQQKMTDMYREVIIIQKLHGNVFSLLFLRLNQLFGLCFYSAVLVSLILSLLVTDIAFGWQSSLQIGEHAIHKTIEIIALPWSWFISSAHPTLADISGSKIVLKDSTAHLSTANLTSWWPFICLSLFFYGLLPRVFFFVSTKFLTQRKLNSLMFTGLRYSTLHSRMTTSHLSTQAEIIPDTRTHQLSPKNTTFSPNEENDAQQFYILIPRELKHYQNQILKQQTTEQQPGRILFPSMDITEDKNIFTTLSEDKKAVILLIQEGWMVPIQETTNYIATLRKYVLPLTELHIGLLGKPTNESTYRECDESAQKIWKRKLAQLTDPFLDVATYPATGENS